jgi:hypothetical protein
MNKSISESMEIPNLWAVSAIEEIHESWKRNETVSDIALEVANSIRREELNTSVPLSDYEKKILLVGLFIGQKHGKSIALSSLPPEIKMLLQLKAQMEEGE